MLLLHGLFGTLGNLGVISRAFANDYLVYQIDLPNHGLSPHFKDMTYLFQAEEIKKLVDKEQIQDLTLIGHSMGGKVAMAFALLYPNLVEKLVILDISPVAYQSYHHQQIIQALCEVEKNRLFSRVEADAILADYIEESAIRQFLLSSYYKDETGYMVWRFNLSTIIAQYEQITGWPLFSTPFLGPTLFLKGSDSDYIQPEHRASIIRQFPKAKASIVANTGHWLHSQKPQSVIRHISAFFEAVDLSR